MLAKITVCSSKEPNWKVQVQCHDMSDMVKYIEDKIRPNLPKDWVFMKVSMEWGNELISLMIYNLLDKNNKTANGKKPIT